MSRIISSLSYRSRFLIKKIRHAFSLTRNTQKTEKIHNYARLIANAEAMLGSFDGKDILEVGSDPSGDFLNFLVNNRSVASACGINPCLPNNVNGLRFSLLKEDARKMSFADNTFDIIFSISVFEHVHNLESALAEMYRVLRPGGFLFTEFGPIWSSVWGHHLWIYHGDSVRHWENTPLPPYAHLLMSERDLRSWCDTKYNDSILTHKICEYVFKSDEQNRLFYSDYENLFLDSDFKTLFLTGYPDLPFPNGYTSDSVYSLFHNLKTQYPDKHGFGYHVLSALLAKPF